MRRKEFWSRRNKYVMRGKNNVRRRENIMRRINTVMRKEKIMRRKWCCFVLLWFLFMHTSIHSSSSYSSCRFKWESSYKEYNMASRESGGGRSPSETVPTDSSNTRTKPEDSSLVKKIHGQISKHMNVWRSSSANSRPVTSEPTWHQDVTSTSQSYPMTQTSYNYPQTREQNVAPHWSITVITRLETAIRKLARPKKKKKKKKITVVTYYVTCRE